MRLVYGEDTCMTRAAGRSFLKADCNPAAVLDLQRARGGQAGVAAINRNT